MKDRWDVPIFKVDDGSIRKKCSIREWLEPPAGELAAVDRAFCYDRLAQFSGTDEEMAAGDIRGRGQPSLETPTRWN